MIKQLLLPRKDSWHGKEKTSSDNPHGVWAARGILFRRGSCRSLKEKEKDSLSLLPGRIATLKLKPGKT
ncbi:hypothetical protein DV515_00006638 [Chloebia gouldiae]|uniref:Uncharacterized protein n=1 Tax=Chloebia gouldiae TaxID=44316 RepID=A0A3L8SJR6_CHLGU|nr:hypothetical protein DV515_00006638 [Chloebia gouldiae]